MRFLTAGESHGPQLTAIIEGVPSGFSISIEEINDILKKRQGGYGRGRRMEIENDQVQIKSGIRFGKTTGAPITLVIENKDYSHWKKIMSVDQVDDESARRVSKPRPGHADLNGGLKYNHRDLRNILERSSARETAIRVAVGALVKQLLKPYGIILMSHVVNIGGIQSKTFIQLSVDRSLEQLQKQIEQSEVRCAEEIESNLMIKKIDEAKEIGDSIGGIVEVVALGLPIGLGSHVHWDLKLDGKIAQSILSIQAFKGVEIGMGFKVANLPGSMVHDEILWSEEKGFYRSTNRAGGIEGGMTTGEPLIVRGVMKPIPTLYKPLQSVDIDTKEAFAASIERSDACAVPAASIVAEHVIAWELANAFFEKFSGDSYEEITHQYQIYKEQIRKY
ncbi:chorismate synthase [Tepidibacillus infernus]|uniref:Chorismate synthase n=1 Tax=Tepidibacillus decaturensis TaxID=1413211 RepID=A0A135L458_9BACI|nr:chorismate synthase [Tepidibacillus decaturensis]KXG43633.1 chorismate synthase [Tepidibacillus decaturensis]